MHRHASLGRDGTFVAGAALRAVTHLERLNFSELGDGQWLCALAFLSSTVEVGNLAACISIVRVVQEVL